jgi:hypothetical protein
MLISKMLCMLFRVPCHLSLLLRCHAANAEALGGTPAAPTDQGNDTDTGESVMNHFARYRHPHLPI